MGRRQHLSFLNFVELAFSSTPPSSFRGSVKAAMSTADYFFDFDFFVFYYYRHYYCAAVMRTTLSTTTTTTLLSLQVPLFRLVRAS